MTPQFILAKYVPDLSRMEPRNIGVFVWWKGEIHSKFLGTSEIAEFVNETDTYERWLKFWERRISGKAVTPNRGKPVSKTDPKCMEALLSNQKGNYILVDAGELLQPIRKGDLKSATEYLFNDLVAIKEPKAEEGQASFPMQCDSVIEKTRLPFKKREPVKCMSRGVRRHLHPDYYIGNGHPDAIFQRARVSKEESVNSAAYLVTAIIDQGIVAPEACRVLIRSSEVSGTVAQEGMKLFEQLCGTIDIDNPDAPRKIAAVAGRNGSR